MPKTLKPYDYEGKDLSFADTQESSDSTRVTETQESLPFAVDRSGKEDIHQRSSSDTLHFTSGDLGSLKTRLHEIKMHLPYYKQGQIVDRGQLIPESRVLERHTTGSGMHLAKVSSDLSVYEDQVLVYQKYILEALIERIEASSSAGSLKLRFLVLVSDIRDKLVSIGMEELMNHIVFTEAWRRVAVYLRNRDTFLR
jgi:hypothetical protein